MSEGIYYLKLGGKVEGPYTIGQIYDLWAARKINSQTQFARIEEMDKWLPLAELTLTIAPPRPAMPKAPSVEASPASSPRTRAVPSFRPEDYMPALPPKTEGAARSARRPSGFEDLLSGKLAFRLETGIGLSLVVGAVLALYFMFGFPPSVDGKEISQDRLIMKQNGVIIGIGLVLLGGVLIVARQIKQISMATPKPESTGKSDRKLA